MYKLRKVSEGEYDTRGYSNEETIAHLMLQKPSEINSALTYTYGMDDDRFPLTFATEGQGKVGVVDIDTQTWTWKTMGRLKWHSPVAYFNATDNPTPGKGGGLIEVHFIDGLIIEQYGLLGPDGKTAVRVMRDCGPSAYGHKYLLQYKNVNPNSYIDPNLFKRGQHWSMTAPTISESYSKGNRSNVMGPGKMTSQLQYHRYTKEIAGNINNVVVQYEFKTAGGGTTNKWINEEIRQFDINVRIMNEEALWLAEYNRTDRGEIMMLDLDNNKPIPETAGMFEICRESNYDTYGEMLTLRKLERTFGDVWAKDTYNGKMEVILYGGTGGLRDFDAAIKRDVRNNGFIQALGDKMISGSGQMLQYGGVFNRYITPEGHVITTKHLSFLDNGTPADLDKANGRLHPDTGLPMCSHKLMAVDHSIYPGERSGSSERNIRIVRQKGQIYKTGVYKGLTDVPESWGMRETGQLSTQIDMSAYEVKLSRGLQVNRSEKMFMLECEL